MRCHPEDVKRISEKSFRPPDRSFEETIAKLR